MNKICKVISNPDIELVIIKRKRIDYDTKSKKFRFTNSYDYHLYDESYNKGYVGRFESEEQVMLYIKIKHGNIEIIT